MPDSEVLVGEDYVGTGIRVGKWIRPHSAGSTFPQSDGGDPPPRQAGADGGDGGARRSYKHHATDRRRSQRISATTNFDASDGLKGRKKPFLLITSVKFFKIFLFFLYVLFYVVLDCKQQ